MPTLIKLYTDAQRRFVNQINGDTQISWEKNFNSMRHALNQCLQKLNIESAVQQYYKLYSVMQEYPPENNITVAGAITELVVESGWMLCDQYIGENNNKIIQSIIFYISTAVMHYNCINIICADYLLEKEVFSESERHYQSAYDMLIDFLKRLRSLRLEYDINYFPMESEVRKLVLKRAAVSMKQHKAEAVTEFLSQYKKLSSECHFDESEEVQSERLLEFNGLQLWLKEKNKAISIKKEVNRRKKKIKNMPSIEAIDKISSICILNDLNTSLEAKKECETSQKILDEINLRQNEILHKILSINEIGDVIIESVILETLQNDLFLIANDIVQSIELFDSVSDVNTINLSITDISETLKNVDKYLPDYLVSIPYVLNIIPLFSNDRYSEFIDYFSIILKEYNYDAFLFGSANYKIIPNDLDILINNQDMKKVNALIEELVLNHGGSVLANYEKINRHVIKMFFHGIFIDFILSSETILEHSRRLDFTIGALYFDIRRKIMFSPNAHALQHIQVQQLHTISNAKQMFEHDPSVIFRAVRIMASEGFILSEDTYLAIKEVTSKKNPFIKMNPDKLYHEMVQLFFSGHAVRTLEILVKELEIFQYIFTGINELNRPMYFLTLSMLECVADMSDDYFKNSEQYAYPPPPSLFYYTVYWFVFIKNHVPKSIYPNINLARGITPNLNNEVDYNNRRDLYALEYYHQFFPKQEFIKNYNKSSKIFFWSNENPEQSIYPSNFYNHIK